MQSLKIQMFIVEDQDLTDACANTLHSMHSSTKLIDISVLFY